MAAACQVCSTECIPQRVFDELDDMAIGEQLVVCTDCLFTFSSKDTKMTLVHKETKAALVEIVQIATNYTD
jgi:hypothetical protein